MAGSGDCLSMAGSEDPIDFNVNTLYKIRDLPVSARLACRLLSGLSWGTLDLRLPDGRLLRVTGKNPGKPAELRIIELHAFNRILRGGNIGFAEAYLRGEWTTPNLAALLEVLARKENEIYRSFGGKRFFRFAQRFGHLLHRNSRRGSRRNIEYHYDLGNSFYERWLDRTMTYSSAKFSNSGEQLSMAQTNKYRSLAEQLQLKPEHTVLEIGSGWGGFAEFAARDIGCRVTGITISPEQYRFAKERIFKQGLSERVEFRLQDYRDLSDRFDRIASIEMFEAVGEEYWPTFFDKVRGSLNPDGRAALQIITIADEHFEAYRRGADFIQKYIFPGGMLPSPTVLRDVVTKAGLEWRENITFGVDYAETLARWRSRFLNAWPDIEPMGFDDRFRRMWEYYLAYCEAGFRTGRIDVTQISLARG